MVPEGWDVLPFGEVAEFRNGLNFTKDDDGETIKVVGIPDFWQKTQLTDFSNLKTIQCRGDIGAANLLHSGDLLFVRSNGNPELVGRCLYFPSVDEPISFSGFTIRARVNPKKMMPTFAALVMNSEIPRVQFRRSGGGTNISNLSQDALGLLSVPLPPLAEQKRIAEVLGVWDRAIAVAGQQLDLARTQKRALMQTLLTPTRRFPGFDGQPWKEVRLGDVADIIVSNVDKKNDPDEPRVRLCNYMDVYRYDTITPDMSFMDASASPAQISRFRLKAGDVLITKDSETPQDIAIPSYVESSADDLICGYHLAIIRPRQTITGRFLKSVFETPETRYFFSTRANGATRFGLTISALENAPIKVTSVAEQKKITDFLSSSETEITTLETQITRLQSEKKALMQQLLTGKKRLAV